MDPESMVSAREEVRKAVKQGLVYGNGILELTWQYKKVTRKRLIAKFVPATKLVPDPITGQPVHVQTGESRRVVAEVSYQQELNFPELRHRDIRDCYWDPNLSSPNFQLGRFFAVRQLVPVGELKLLRTNPMFDIPDDDKLVQMAAGKTGTYAENLKATPDTYRNIMAPATVDYVENPDSKRLEVIRYYNKDRLVWLFNREWVAFNQSNPVGFLPFLGVFYVVVPNRAYAMSVRRSRASLTAGLTNWR
jgi:hypothetical protein